MAEIELFVGTLLFSFVIDIVKSGVLYEFEEAIVFLCGLVRTPGVKPKAETVLDWPRAGILPLPVWNALVFGA